MSFQSGNGGAIAVNGSELNIAKWTLRAGNRLVENTHSGVSNTNFEVVVQDNAATVEVPFDTDVAPEAFFGLVAGAQVTLVFFYGTSGLTATLTDTLVETVETVDDNASDIIRYTVSTRGGFLSAVS